MDVEVKNEWHTKEKEKIRKRQQSLPDIFPRGSKWSEIKYFS